LLAHPSVGRLLLIESDANRKKAEGRELYSPEQKDQDGFME